MPDYCLPTIHTRSQVQALIQSHRTSRVGRLVHFCNMDIVLFLLHIRVLKPLLVFYFRVEEIFAGGKFRGWKISRNSIRSGYYFRGRKISRKIKIRENSENLLHAKNWCYTVLVGAYVGPHVLCNEAHPRVP